jgi:hypothetical protein
MEQSFGNSGPLPGPFAIAQFEGTIDGTLNYYFF